MKKVTPYKNIKIGDEEQREDVLEDLPILACSFSPIDFESLIESLSEYPDSREFLDRNYPGLIGKSFNCFPQIMDEMLKSDLFFETAKTNFEEMKYGVLAKVDLDNVKQFFYFIETLRDKGGFEDIVSEFDDWKKLYDMVPTSFIDMAHIPNIFQLSFSEKPEDKELLSRVLRITGKNIIFTTLLAGDPDTRFEKMTIIKSMANDDLDSLQFVGSGVSGVVLKSGKKVIKLSSNIGQFEIPYHPRLLMPHFRKAYKDYTCLEVYNFGKVKSANITDEKLLEIYKELEADGIIWTDAKKENLVELLEDNTLPEYNLGEDFNLYGFLKDSRYPTNNHKVLKKGDVVICDLNHIYTKDNPLAELRIGMPDKVIEDYLDQKDREVRRTKERKEDDGR